MKAYWDKEWGHVVLTRGDGLHGLGIEEAQRLAVELNKAVIDMQSSSEFESLLVKELKGRLEHIQNLVIEGGQTDGGHHKQWYLDQILRVSQDTEDAYKSLVEKEFCGDWDEGIAP